MLALQLMSWGTPRMSRQQSCPLHGKKVMAVLHSGISGEKSKVLSVKSVKCRIYPGNIFRRSFLQGSNGTLAHGVHQPQDFLQWVKAEQRYTEYQRYQGELERFPQPASPLQQSRVSPPNKMFDCGQSSKPPAAVGTTTQAEPRNPRPLHGGEEYPEL